MPLFNPSEVLSANLFGEARERERDFVHFAVMNDDCVAERPHVNNAGAIQLTVIPTKRFINDGTRHHCRLRARDCTRRIRDNRGDRDLTESRERVNLPGANLSATGGGRGETSPSVRLISQDAKAGNSAGKSGGRAEERWRGG